MDDGGSISMTIGGGAVGLVLGFIVQLIRSRVTRAKEDDDMVDAGACKDFRSLNERDHRDLFHRMAVAERDLAAFRATQDAMRETMSRMDAKLDRLLERNGLLPGSTHSAG